MSTALVKVSVGQFDCMSSERETQVHVWISETLRSSYYLPADMADQLRPLPWPELIRTAHAYWAARVFIDTSRAQKEALAEWLAVDEHESALYEAWRQDQIRRHPVAGGLAVELEKLRARVAELAAGELTIYRAECFDLTGGHYRTRAAAEDHCEQYARRDPDFTGCTFRWVQDGPDPSDDDPSYLYAVTEDGEVDTGYQVTPLLAQTAYDSDGDE